MADTKKTETLSLREKLMRIQVEMKAPKNLYIHLVSTNTEMLKASKRLSSLWRRNTRSQQS